MTSLRRGLLLLALGGCGRPPGVDAASGAGCRILEHTLALPDGLTEASGAAWSRHGTRAFWSHNDSGREPELFLLAAGGRDAERIRVRGAKPIDLEDLASIPCEGGRCLLLADIGNNGRKGEPLALFEVPEPAAGHVTAPRRILRAEFPDHHRRDAEALFALPDGSVYLITKGNQEPIELYRWPMHVEGDSTATLELVRQLAPQPEQFGDRVTGASASPDGRYVAVRTYGLLAIYRTAELLAGGEPAARMDLTPLGEAQGEGVALADDGTVVLVSESGSRHLPGTAAVLRCQLP